MHNLKVCNFKEISSNHFPLHISVHLCDNGLNGGCSQVCNKDGIKAICSCNSGFKLDADGVTCIESKS